MTPEHRLTGEGSVSYTDRRSKQVPHEDLIHKVLRQDDSWCAGVV